MANNDSIRKILIVTVVLCLVCSIVVSATAVMLRPMQQANQELDFKRNVLAAGNLIEPGRSVEEIFDERIIRRAVEFESGEFTDAVDVEEYDPRRAARDASTSTNLSRGEDIAGISRREDYTIVYLVEDESGELVSLILPVRGYGLWSTMYGFLALEADGNTISGIGFYEHGETPGLGGEIDNESWQEQWEGKKLYEEDGEVALSVIKGSVDPSADDAEHKVDGLSGATLTSRGVQNMMRFWFGEMGFKPFLTKLQEGEA